MPKFLCVFATIFKSSRPNFIIDCDPNETRRGEFSIWIFGGNVSKFWSKNRGREKCLELKSHLLLRRSNEMETCTNFLFDFLRLTKNFQIIDLEKHWDWNACLLCTNEHIIPNLSVVTTRLVLKIWLFLDQTTEPIGPGSIILYFQLLVLTLFYLQLQASFSKTSSQLPRQIG